MSLFFRPVARGGILNALFADVGGGLMLLYKPWKAKDRKSKKYMGVGAFNLVKRSAYRALGGHSAIAMHPIDDVMLGKVLKQCGFSQDCLLGDDFLKVKWYATVRDLIHGVMKNAFAVYRFRLTNVLLGILFIIIVNILPFWAIFFTSGMVRGLFGAAMMIRILSYMHVFLDAHISPWYSLWSLVTPYINIYITIRATITTILNRGITWRGTHYPLDELKAKKNQAEGAVSTWRTHHQGRGDEM